MDNNFKESATDLTNNAHTLLYARQQTCCNKQRPSTIEIREEFEKKTLLLIWSSGFETESSIDIWAPCSATATFGKVVEVIVVVLCFV